MTSLHELTSQEKIELGFDNKDGNDLSQRKLTAEYNISLGSVSNVLKPKPYLVSENFSTKKRLNKNK
ncbi:unnamed protein product [Rotaria sordida]|uniref:HTH psq-type domain-containing protein n=1 Tax=Rotaria sordida TaxID=392033 RepID=A0A814D7E2_9BILA|nr:unnamed protein product [Rotaria sordida]